MGRCLPPAEQIAEATGFLLVLSVGWAALSRDVFRVRRDERRARRLARQAEAAAVEASSEVGAFAPELVRSAVGEILELASRSGDQVDARQPSTRRDAPRIAQWARAHHLNDDTSIQGAAVIDLLRVVNRARESEDRVVVRVRVLLEAAAAAGSHRQVKVDERWTLARAGEGWQLVEFDSAPLASTLLVSPSIPGAWADTERLRERSLKELAEEDQRLLSAHGAELVDLDADPDHQLLDLSVIDGRYLPALVEAVLGHLIDAWEQATGGSYDPLAQLASNAAREQLLHPVGASDRLRLVLRDARLRRWAPRTIDPTENPPVLEIDLTVEAVRFLVESLTSERRSGSPDYPHDIPLRWALELTTSDENPWRLVRSSNPAADIPGVLPPGDGPLWGRDDSSPLNLEG